MEVKNAQNIIQILLYEGGPLKIDELAKYLHIKKNEVEASLGEVKNLLSILNLKLIETPSSLEISLSSEISTLINKNKLEELKGELSESALQTLAVIIYKPLCTKAEIDFVRGVDSGRSIKNLLTRGIIEKQDLRNRKIYTPTTESLRYLNLENVQKVDKYEEISSKLKELLESK